MATVGRGIPVATVEDVMHAIWDELTNDPISTGWASAGITIVDDGGTPAVSLNGSTPSGATPTGPSDWLDGSYLVITGPHAAGGAWQCEISKTTGDDLNYRFAFRGGWANATEFASATNTVNATPIRWNDSLDPGAGSTLELFATNDPTFGVAPGPTGQALTSFGARIVLSTGVSDSGLLCGGIYRPVRQDGVGADPDTHPCAVLGGQPSIINQTSTNTWGYATPGSSCLSRCAVENAHTTADTSTAGYAALRGNSDVFNGSTPNFVDFNGNHLTQNLVLCRSDFNGAQGEICPEIATGIDDSADVDGATSAGYQKADQIILRKP